MSCQNDIGANHARTLQAHTTLALAAHHDASLHRVSQNLQALTSSHTATPYVDSHGTPSLSLWTPAAWGSGCSTRAPSTWSTLGPPACTHFSFGCPARLSPALRAPRPPGWQPLSLQLSSQGTRPLQREPWDFPGPHVLKLQPSHYDNEYIPVHTYHN